MINLIWELITGRYEYHYDGPWGIVESVDREHDTQSFVVLKNEWAPGIWAGSEKWNIEFKDPNTNKVTGFGMVLGVNMEKREVSVLMQQDTMTVKSGYEIHHKVDNGKL